MTGFSNLTTLLTKLTWKNTKFEWSEKCENDFRELKNILVYASIFKVLFSDDGYMIYGDTSRKGLVCVLMQHW